MVLLPVTVLVPFAYNILFGQAYLLVLGLMMGGFISESKNKLLPASLYYSVAIVLKISPAILLVYLLVRKKYRLLLYTSLDSMVLFLSAIPFTGMSFLQEYIFSFIPRMVQNEINNPYAGNYQSVTVLMRTLFVPDQLLNPHAPFNAPFIFSIGKGIITGLLFFF